MSNYEIRGNQVYSAKDKLVAVLDENGNPQFAPGMAGAHTDTLREFLEASKVQLKVNEHEEEVNTESLTEEEEPEAPVQTVVEDIPEAELPPFSNELGVYTPGFQEFVLRNKLTPEQTAAIIKKITKK